MADARRIAAIIKRDSSNHFTAFKTSKIQSKAKKFDFVMYVCIHTKLLFTTLAAHTAHVICVNVIYEWRNLEFKTDCERKIFEKLFMVILSYSQSFCQKYDERKLQRKYCLKLILLSDISTWRIELWTCLISHLCLVSDKFFIAHTILFGSVLTCTTYTTITTTRIA